MASSCFFRGHSNGSAFVRSSHVPPGLPVRKVGGSGCRKKHQRAASFAKATSNRGQLHSHQAGDEQTRITEREKDGSAEDAGYGIIDVDYGVHRQPESAIAALIEAALDSTSPVLNVGAGTGSYEPVDRAVTAVEPLQHAAATPLAFDASDRRSSWAPGLRAWRFRREHGDLHHSPLGRSQPGTQGGAACHDCSIVILTCDPGLVWRFRLDENAPSWLAGWRRKGRCAGPRSPACPRSSPPPRLWS